MADSRLLKALGIGDLQLELPNGSQTKQALLKDVVHPPKMTFTLISVSRLNAAKNQVTFKDRQCVIKSPQGCMMVNIPLTNGCYHLPDPVHNDISTMLTYHW